METASPKYIHTEIDHTLTDPSLLVPLFKKMFSPASVCDVGCGIGNFLFVFKQQGVPHVLGLDGNWVNQMILSKYLGPHEFQQVDFENNVFDIPTKFDLCICLEVAEHVSENKANDFVDFLTRISNTIIFSAALPYQGGINHINEQKEEYWQGKFEKKGFVKYDIIRHQIILQKDISAHYRRNLVVYSCEDLSRFPQVPLGHVAVQENCKQRLYIDVMNGHFSSAAMLKFALKVVMMKATGKRLSGILKKVRGR